MRYICPGCGDWVEADDSPGMPPARCACCDKVLRVSGGLITQLAVARRLARRQQAAERLRCRVLPPPVALEELVAREVMADAAVLESAALSVLALARAVRPRRRVVRKSWRGNVLGAMTVVCFGVTVVLGLWAMAHQRRVIQQASAAVPSETVPASLPLSAVSAAGERGKRELPEVMFIPPAEVEMVREHTATEGPVTAEARPVESDFFGVNVSR